jgi:hypothetical protein
MSWLNISSELKDKVIAVLSKLASNEENAEMAEAYSEAAAELKLWDGKEDLFKNPFTAWADEHKEELAPYKGKAVAIHLEKGVLMSAEPEQFFNGNFEKEVQKIIGGINTDIFLMVL